MIRKIKAVALWDMDDDSIITIKLYGRKGTTTLREDVVKLLSPLQQTEPYFCLVDCTVIVDDKRKVKK